MAPVYPAGFALPAACAQNPNQKKPISLSEEEIWALIERIRKGDQEAVKALAKAGAEQPDFFTRGHIDFLMIEAIAGDNLAVAQILFDLSDQRPEIFSDKDLKQLRKLSSSYQQAP